MTSGARRVGRLAAAALALAAAAEEPARAADITTAQIDTARTMAYGSETYLTTGNVNGSHFGKLFSRTVDGAIYAQPLYLQSVAIASKTINVVYVATSHNNVYAFDADNPNAANPIWSVNVGPYDTPAGWNTGFGIFSTPAIVRASQTMYVTAATNENGSRVYRLHALDLLTGAEKFGGPVLISGSVPGTAGDAVNGVVTFTAQGHVQRTGLAISGNNVIFGFAGGGGDTPVYHGWIFSYNTSTLQQTGIFNAAPNNVTDETSYFTGSGIWQSGRAPAVDGNGLVYFASGDGVWDGTC